MDDLGKIAYAAYCGSTGGVSAVTGQLLPTWSEQTVTIRMAWDAAGAAVYKHVIAEVSAAQTPAGEPDGELIDPKDAEIEDESSEEVEPL